MKTRRITKIAALSLVALSTVAVGYTAFADFPAAARQTELTPQQQADPLLTSGHTVFVNNCNRCHSLPDVHYYSEPRLTAIVDKMSRKAQLTPEQHDAVLKYLQDVRAM